MVWGWRASVNIHRSIGALLGGTCLVAVSAPAFAQNTSATTASGQPAGQEQADPNAIVVTAQKRTQRLLDVPQSISVISGESLDKQHALRLSDYLTRIPSANVVESQPGISRIVLR